MRNRGERVLQMNHDNDCRRIDERPSSTDNYHNDSPNASTIDGMCSYVLLHASDRECSEYKPSGDSSCVEPI